MSELRFALIGDGSVAQYHRKAIEHIGGEIGCVIDPKYDPTFNKNTWRDVSSIPSHAALKMYSGEGRFSCDYFVICSPSFLHRQQIKFLLGNIDIHSQIICEKPAFLSWEPIIDSDKINIVLQLRYLPNLPKKADLVKSVFVRDEEYFKSWKGDPKKTGGLFFSLFIHYIDLAIQMDADFEGIVLSEGEQERWIGMGPPSLKWAKNGYKKRTDYKETFDLLNINTQSCYNAMYEDIISGGGIKPKDTFYLSWILSRNSEVFGYGRNGLNRHIKIGRELL